jgi:regulator of protease activity HflC (stomatin/prohibitin superfamily)
MFGIKRVVIAQYERGLLLRNRTVQTVLEPGVYWMFDPLKKREVQVYDLNNVEFMHPQKDFIVKLCSALCEQFFTVVDVNSHQVGLLYLDEVLSGILEPGSRHLFWKQGKVMRVELLDIQDNPRVPDPVARLLIRTRNAKLLNEVRNAVYAVCVAENTKGLLYVDGQLQEQLKPGIYGFWCFNREVEVKLIDQRVQMLEVSGQEILTRDKVSIRVNLSAQYRVVDAILADQRLSDVQSFIYRELQLILRQVIGTRTLDVLLGEKGELDELIIKRAKLRLSEYGLDTQSIGVKDIILPGDMKTILNQVVEAEKAAQANVIKRREETAATRSLLNTAKLMESNPILLRLKELEALEKITGNVQSLTLYGGLDGMLNDTVKLQLPG